MAMKVVILITINSEESYNNSTLILSSIGIGFPSANVEIYLNGGCNRWYDRIKKRCGPINLFQLEHRFHHAEWIKLMIEINNDELIIIDGDVTMWKEWTFKFNTLLAGYFVPLMWNEFAQCISYPRLHTSFLQISNCNELREVIGKIYPMSIRSPDYAPLDMFMPCTKFAFGKPVFWDSCSVLYNSIGGTQFNQEQLDCYDHLNSASFIDIMSNNMENGKDFKNLHNTINRIPELLKNRWDETNMYYESMHKKALQILGV
jgi:hypothetical protein